MIKIKIMIINIKKIQNKFNNFNIIKMKINKNKIKNKTNTYL